MLYDMLAELDHELSHFGPAWPSLRMHGIDAPIDIRREDNRYLVEMDLPGVDPSSIDVTLDNGWLSVTAQRSNRRDLDDHGWVVHERADATLVRGFAVGDSVDPDAITADYTNGVLSLVLPLAEHAKPHTITVTSGSKRELTAGSDSSEPRSARKNRADDHGGVLARLLPWRRHHGHRGQRLRVPVRQPKAKAGAA